MKRDRKSEAWTLFLTLGGLLASWDKQTHRFIVLHSASAPGHPEPPPALVEVGESGLITSIKRIAVDPVGRVIREGVSASF